MNIPKIDRPGRAETRDVVELRQLKAAQPDLASAADMQIELLGAQRRVQSRVPLPSGAFDQPKPDRQRRRPVLQFKDIPIDWSDFRLMIRQTADILRRFETLELPSNERIQALARDGQIGPSSRAGTRARCRPPAGKPTTAAQEKELLDQVLLLAMRPFLARCAEALLPEAGAGRLAAALLPTVRGRAGICRSSIRRPSGC